MDEEKTRRPLSSLITLAEAERLRADAAKAFLFGDYQLSETLKKQAEKLEDEAQDWQPLLTQQLQNLPNHPIRNVEPELPFPQQIVQAWETGKENQP